MNCQMPESCTPSSAVRSSASDASSSPLSSWRAVSTSSSTLPTLAVGRTASALVAEQLGSPTPASTDADRPPHVLERHQGTAEVRAGNGHGPHPRAGRQSEVAAPEPGHAGREQQGGHQQQRHQSAPTPPRRREGWARARTGRCPSPSPAAASAGPARRRRGRRPGPPTPPPWPAAAARRSPRPARSRPRRPAPARAPAPTMVTTVPGTSPVRGAVRQADEEAHRQHQGGRGRQRHQHVAG